MKAGAPGGNFCVDRYPRGIKGGYWFADAAYARPGPARATVTLARAAYNIAKGIRGPSSTGPWTYYGEADSGYVEEIKVGGVGTGRGNLGLW